MACAHYYRSGDGMKILARLIRGQLKLDAGKYGHCAIYENELQRLCR